jgi:hypothetical protein
MDMTDVVSTALDTVRPTSAWTRISTPFSYSNTLYGSKTPKYILMNIFTSANLGDELYVDDIEFIYNKKISNSLKLVPHDGLNAQNISIPIIV